MQDDRRFSVWRGVGGRSAETLAEGGPRVSWRELCPLGLVVVLVLCLPPLID